MSIRNAKHISVKCCHELFSIWDLSSKSLFVLSDSGLVREGKRGNMHHGTMLRYRSIGPIGLEKEKKTNKQTGTFL